MKSCLELRTNRSEYCRNCNKVNDYEGWHLRIWQTWKKGITFRCRHWRKVESEIGNIGVNND